MNDGRDRIESSEGAAFLLAVQDKAERSSGNNEVVPGECPEGGISSGEGICTQRLEDDEEISDSGSDGRGLHGKPAPRRGGGGHIGEAFERCWDVGNHTYISTFDDPSTLPNFEKAKQRRRQVARTIRKGCLHPEVDGYGGFYKWRKNRGGDYEPIPWKLEIRRRMLDGTRVRISKRTKMEKTSNENGGGQAPGNGGEMEDKRKSCEDNGETGENL